MYLCGKSVVAGPLQEDWENADKGGWIDRQRPDDLDEMDRLLVKSLEITCMTGKGNNHLVPIIFSPDTVPAIRLLCDPSIREQVDVRADSPYIFASILQSEDEVYGCHAVNRMCKMIKSQLANIKTLFATANRHHVSTLFAVSDMPRKERQLFYKHMGHYEDIMNVDIRPHLQSCN